jgi:hypothetical protein
MTKLGKRLPILEAYSERTILKKLEMVNGLIAQAIDDDGDPLDAIDSTSTWQAPMYFKPFVYRNGFLWGEYEEYTGRGKNEVHKERWSKRNMEEGVGWMTDVSRWLRTAINKYQKEKANPKPEED